MPLRFPRPVVPVIAMGMAAVWVVTAGAPALAEPVQQQEWWLTKLDVSQAWQASRGAGITVAVLSDGVDATQPDLRGSVVTGPDYTRAREAASTLAGVQGTPVAALIAGHGHGPGRTAGIMGVAPAARILSVRVTLDPRDPALVAPGIAAGLPDAIAAGIRYAVRHGAHVIDLPLDPGQAGVSNTGAAAAAAGGSSAERAAVAWALSKKVVLVAPAGDDAGGTDAPNYPAAYRGVIAVGAFDHNFLKAPYSSRQPYVALTAAGTGVIAPGPGGRYTTVSSTSAASAVVSGIVALIRSRYPGLTPAQVTAALTRSTVFRPAGGTRDGSGYGTADAARALSAAASLAGPAASRAGAGALPLTTPARPAAVPLRPDKLTPRILRAAIVSVSVLIALLLLVAIYSAIARRRERKDARAAAQWARAAQDVSSPYESPQDADRMLEFFAAPVSDPVSPASRFPPYQAAHYQAAQFPARELPSRRAPGRPAEPADRTAAAAPVAAQPVAARTVAARTAAGRTAAAGSTGPDVRAAASAGTKTIGAWVPLGPAPAGGSRAPQVSGAPPWEPAAKPDSELPWAAGPGPAPASDPPPVIASAPRILPAWPTTGTAWETSGREGTGGHRGQGQSG